MISGKAGLDRLRSGLVPRGPAPLRSRSLSLPTISLLILPSSVPLLVPLLVRRLCFLRVSQRCEQIVGKNGLLGKRTVGKTDCWNATASREEVAKVAHGPPSLYWARRGDYTIKRKLKRYRS